MLIVEPPIDAGEGTENLVSISAAVFELSRKSGRGGNLPPPLSGARDLKRARLKVPGYLKVSRPTNIPFVQTCSMPWSVISLNVNSCKT